MIDTFVLLEIVVDLIAWLVLRPPYAGGWLHLKQVEQIGDEGEQIDAHLIFDFQKVLQFDEADVVGQVLGAEVLHGLKILHALFLAHLVLLL